MFKIAIPKPCKEDWNKMTPDQQGRHCSLCAKTVTDFTTMSDEAIKDYFIAKKEEQLCGRFKNEQLSRITIDLPGNILKMSMPLWKKFLAACLIIFSVSLFSCDTTVDGKKPIIHATEIEIKKLPGQKDVIVGGMAFHWDSTICKTIKVPLDSVVTFGVTTFFRPDTLHIDTASIADPLPLAHIPDSAINISLKHLTDSNTITKPDSLKTKNPQKADSSNCDTQIYY